MRKPRQAFILMGAIITERKRTDNTTSLPIPPLLYNSLHLGNTERKASPRIKKGRQL